MTVRNQDLTTLATVNDELGLTSDSGGAQDLRVERYIAAISDQIASYCNRVLHATENSAGDTLTATAEKAAGFGTNHLIVARTPIIAVTSITLDGSTIDSNSYEIDGDGTRGILYREDGWNWTASLFPGAAPELAPHTEDKDYLVTYTGGYVTPTQATALTETRTLPYDLEDAAIQWITTRWLSKGQDGRISSEKLGQAAVSYAGIGGADSDAGGVPAAVRAVLNRYRRAVIA